MWQIKSMLTKYLTENDVPENDTFRKAPLLLPNSGLIPITIIISMKRLRLSCSRPRINCDSHRVVHLWISRPRPASHLLLAETSKNGQRTGPETELRYAGPHGQFGAIQSHSSTEWVYGGRGLDYYDLDMTLILHANLLRRGRAIKEGTYFWLSMSNVNSPAPIIKGSEWGPIPYHLMLI